MVDKFKLYFSKIDNEEKSNVSINMAIACVFLIIIMSTVSSIYYGYYYDSHSGLSRVFNEGVFSVHSIIYLILLFIVFPSGALFFYKRMFYPSVVYTISYFSFVVGWIDLFSSYFIFYYFPIGCVFIKGCAGIMFCREKQQM